ncbi:hypothetical protein NI18_21505 [Sphingomonas sp. Ant20]|nr:hypothetical protein NI18_21505 [Sphingomonas sp. Ant20]
MTSPIEPKVIYEQLCNDFRSLNGFLWQTPLIIMTLTGGLWFAVASFDMSEMARSRLLLFATLANIIMIIALFRLRYVMQRIQNQIRAHDKTRCDRAQLHNRYLLYAPASTYRGRLVRRQSRSGRLFH